MENITANSQTFDAFEQLMKSYGGRIENDWVEGGYNSLDVYFEVDSSLSVQVETCTKTNMLTASIIPIVGLEHSVVGDTLEFLKAYAKEKGYHGVEVQPTGSGLEEELLLYGFVKMGTSDLLYLIALKNKMLNHRTWLYETKKDLVPKIKNWTQEWVSYFNEVKQTDPTFEYAVSRGLNCIEVYYKGLEIRMKFLYENEKHGLIIQNEGIKIMGDTISQCLEELFPILDRRQRLPNLYKAPMYHFDKSTKMILQVKDAVYQKLCTVYTPEDIEVFASLHKNIITDTIIRNEKIQTHLFSFAEQIFVSRGSEIVGMFKKEENVQAEHLYKQTCLAAYEEEINAQLETFRKKCQ